MICAALMEAVRCWSLRAEEDAVISPAPVNPASVSLLQHRGKIFLLLCLLLLAARLSASAEFTEKKKIN